MTTFARRHPSPLQTQHSRRGPHRHRWERKQPPCNGDDKVMIGLALLLFSCFSIYWTWPTAIVMKDERIATKPVPLASLTKKRPLRGRLVTPHLINNQKANKQQSPIPSIFFEQSPIADGIVVGSGLAGLTAALQILDRGGRVIIIEKEPILGGNSNKASSGINGCCFQQEQQHDGNSSTRVIMTSSFSPVTNDTLALFYEDTFRSAGDVANINLIETLVQQSAPALKWLQERVGVDLLSAPLVQLGGHSRRRTHRPTVGFVGAEIMNAMENAIRSYESSGDARILVEHKVTGVVKDAVGRIRGVQVEKSDKQGGEPVRLRSDSVILATGGFASDRSEGSLLRQYRPELQNMAATAGLFSTGDGIHLAQNIGATTRDMEKIQIHPTGFVDPADPTSPHKVLAAELLRGVGGILLNKQGQRFCNELGTRDYVTDKMLGHDVQYSESRTWNPDTAIPTFYVLLSAEAARSAERHIGTYMRKGLMTKLKGLESLANHLKIPHDTLVSTLREYQSVAAGEGGGDVFGKTDFEGLPGEDLEAEEYYVGEVTPVLHYCMGGVKISPSGEVIGNDGGIIPGLYAVGEVTGGVHGNNRLGGNSLLECAVFGTIVGKIVSLDGKGGTDGEKSHHSPVVPSPMILSPQLERSFTFAELFEHGKPTDCFVGLDGKVYDLSAFLHRHPGGSDSILSLCGIEATETFLGVHSSNVLSQVQKHIMGHLLSTENVPKESGKEPVLQRIIEKDLMLHNSTDECWVVIHGTVYDLTEFSKGHPGGAYIIQKMAGKDATASYEVFHSKEKLKMIKPYVVGQFSH